MNLKRNGIYFILLLHWSCKYGECYCDNNKMKIDGYCMVQATCYHDKSYKTIGFNECVRNRINYNVTFIEICETNPNDTSIYFGGDTERIRHIFVMKSVCTVIPRLKNINSVADYNLHENHLLTLKIDEDFPSLKVLDVSNNMISYISSMDLINCPNLIKLNVSFNMLDSISERTFYSLKYLEILDISFNKLEKINALSFFGLNNLKILRLSNNRLAGTINTFSSLTQLEELDLSYNQIIEIKKEYFENLKHLKVLVLNSNYIASVEWNFLERIPLLAKFDVSYNRIEAVETFTNNSALEYIDVSHNKFTKLYPNIFINKTLSFFSIKGNALQGRLEKGMFEGMKFINELDLSYQNIDTLEDYVFYGLKNLVKLLLNDNKIHTLEKKAFRSLFALELLDLSNNMIHTIDYEKNDLINLRNLYLSDNEITGALEAEIFEGLESLPSLDLSYTSINQIMNQSFVGLLQLNKLNISHSNVHDLQYNALCDLKELLSMDFSYNKLTVFEVNFTCIENLKFLYLSYNFITTLEPILSRNLQELDVAFNNLTSIVSNAFTGLNDLSIIKLSYNSKLKLKFDLVKQIKRLKIISLSGISIDNTNFSTSDNHEFIKVFDISMCNITNITSLRLDFFVNCDELNLSSNKIPHVKHGMFSKNTKIRILNLSFNKISFIQPGSFKDNHEIEVLNVAHNNIFDLEYGIFKGMWGLTHLDVSFNSIRNLERGVFDESLSLSTLIADYNDIKSIDFKDFSETTEIKTLSIGGNPISCLSLIQFETSKPISTRQNLKLTSLVSEFHLSNYHGITCNSGINNIIPNENNAYILLNKTFKHQEQLLEDIKALLKTLTTKDYFNNTSLYNQKSVDFEMKSPLFQNIYLWFIATVILCLVLFKLYKSDIFVPVRRSVSKRRINDFIETETLSH